MSEWPSTDKGYHLLGEIGSGYFGKVWKGEVVEGKCSGQIVAIKKIDLDQCADQKIDELRKNMVLLNLLNHPNILSYKTAFTCRQSLWLIFEIMSGGSIERIVQKLFPNGIKDQTLIATIIKETLEGIRYLHQNNQIHRDIKGGNILVGSDGAIKLSDFGFTAKLKKGQKRSTFIGSPCYMAPEVLEQDGTVGYDSKADIWSLGITALELANGTPPNSDLTAMKLIIKTLEEEPPKLSKESCWDDSFHDFIAQCLVKDPAKRKSADELFKICKSFLGKAKNKEYIVEKIIKQAPPLETKVEKKSDNLVDEFEKNNGKVNTKKINFEFDLNQSEEEEINTENLQLKPTYSSHLTRGDSEYFLKKSLSANNFSDDDLANYNEHKLNPDQIEKVRSVSSNIQNLCTANFVHKEKGGKIKLSKGDDLNFLPEEEF